MRIGRSGAGSAVHWFATLALAAIVAFGWPVPASARKKPARQQQAASPALVAGTVFRDAGFALRGAEVVVNAVDAAAPAPKDKKKDASWKATTDARGEFLLRLPPGPARYNVVVRAPGFKPSEKEVTFTADERQELNFLLESAGSAK